MQITLEIKCPTCLSDSIKKNGLKLYGKQKYQCKNCKRHFIGDHALSYRGSHSRACPHLALHQINMQAIRIIDL